MKHLSALFVLALTACATQAPLDPTVTAAAYEPLICQGAEQCSLYWRRAQVWIAGNSRWKIQTATDSVITTYTPTRGEVSWGYQVLRIPQASGAENIRIYPSCANMFGCRPRDVEVAAAFKAFVKGQ